MTLWYVETELANGRYKTVARFNTFEESHTFLLEYALRYKRHLCLYFKGQEGTTGGYRPVLYVN